MISKTITVANKATMALLGSAILLMPFVSFAQQNAQKPSSTAPGACVNLSQTEQLVVGGVGERVESAKERYREHLESLETQFNELVKNVENRRIENDSEFESRVDSMLAKATTNEQIEAVNNYAETVRQLLNTHRTGVDAVWVQFGVELGALREARAAEYEAMLDEYINNVTAAFDAAEVSCGVDNAVSETMQKLRSDLQAAREQFRQTRQSFDFVNEYATYRQNRISEANKAREQFQADLQMANADLRTALGL